MLREEERELIKKIRKNDGGEADRRLMKHWKMWEQTYAQDTSQEPKGIQDLVRHIRKLLFRRQMEQGFFEFGRLDSSDDTFTTAKPKSEENRFKLHWNFDFPVHKDFHRLAQTSAEDEDPEDWVDGFCKHMEIEALLDE